MKAFKYVNTKITTPTNRKHRCTVFTRPVLNIKCDRNKTFKDRTDLPYKGVECIKTFTISVIFHFGVCLNVNKTRCIDHVILRDMVSQLLCKGPCKVMLLVCVDLKWCIIRGVHDREPVLTEGGTVCPS